MGGMHNVSLPSLMYWKKPSFPGREEGALNLHTLLVYSTKSLVEMKPWRDGKECEFCCKWSEITLNGKVCQKNIMLLSPTSHWGFKGAPFSPYIKLGKSRDIFFLATICIGPN